MKTLRLSTTTEDIATAADIIRSGGLVAFPTETVYGLGADALDADAVGRIYEAKGRPSDNPMIVHIARREDMEKLTSECRGDAVALMERFWPGPLTMVVKKTPEVPDRTTGGLDTVAVRMPDSKAALDLITAADTPIAAPSANISGRPSPTRAKDVIADMDGRIDAVILGEDCRVGIESTVVDVTGSTPVILRPGMITAKDMEAALGKKIQYDESLMHRDGGYGEADPQKGAAASGGSDEGQDFRPKSPGMKYRHYAPKAEMTVIQGPRSRVEAEIKRLKALNESRGRKTGVILFEEDAFAQAAHDFFAKLRDLDAEGVDLILAGALSDTDGAGFAVMNRMMKSAGYNIVKV